MCTTHFGRPVEPLELSQVAKSSRQVASVRASGDCLASSRFQSTVPAGAGARVFVYLTVAIADQLTIVEVTSRGAEAPLATCLAQTLTQTTVDVPADAPRGRFQVTVSGVVAAPPSE